MSELHKLNSAIEKRNARIADLESQLAKAQEEIKKLKSGEGVSERKGGMEITSTALLDCRMYFEHGHICIRTQDARLLWDAHSSELDNCKGVSLGSIYECIKQKYT